MIIISIHDTTQNYSMSVLFNGKIYSIELERLIGIKTGLYKHKQDKLFFEQSELGQSTYIEKDSLTIGDYGVYLMFKYFSDYLGFDKQDIDFLFVSSGKDYKSIFGEVNIAMPKSHHLMHAYSSYFLSGYKRSNILIIDGAGYDLDKNKVELQSMYFAEGNNVKLLKSNFAEKNRNISIGIAYERVSAFLGLTEGKLMGLSGFGQSFTKYHFFDLSAGEAYLKKSLHSIFCDKELFLKHFNLYDDFQQNGYMSEKIVNFVCSFQKEVEHAILYLANHLYEINPCENLCYAGGVALNCLTNTRLKNELKYREVFIQPAASDSGISLGNLLFGYYEYLNLNKKVVLSDENYGLGKSYNDKIYDTLKDYTNYLDYKYIDNQAELIDRLSHKIMYDNICIVYRGGSEFGPRALGNRSIVSSINIPDIQYKINKTKDREYWRPFGIMILEKLQKKYFENSVESKHMLYTANVNLEGSKIFKNVVHNDNTIRLQTIGRKNDFYYKLLNSLNILDIKAIINTSLNGKAEPILETPTQAIEFFLQKSGIDCMFMENYMVTKKTNSTFSTKKLSNITLIESVINNIKVMLIKKSTLKIENVFIDIDIFFKTMNATIIRDNEILGKLCYVYEKEDYVLKEKIENHDDFDLNTLITNVEENKVFLNKLFGMVRGVFIK